jgi:hypothetical protein
MDDALRMRKPVDVYRKMSGGRLQENVGGRLQENVKYSGLTHQPKGNVSLCQASPHESLHK